MTRVLTRHAVVRGRSPGYLGTIALAATLAFAGIACSNPAIENAGGSGGTGGPGGGAGTNGGGGVVIVVTTTVNSGGAGGSSTLVCNSTSTAGCKAQAPDGCGDGINNQGGIEQCDDGNVVPGDGCNGNCKVEPNWDCPADISLGSCTKKIICGDGQIGAGEVCDDGNTQDNDGCDSTCSVQDGAYTCIAGEPCVKTSECGNKRIEAGEDCDDGNATAGDGCSAKCKLEGGWVCPNPGQPCKEAPRCGDGVMQPTIGEVCDDGNQADGDGCSADCKTKGAGCVCTPGSLCTCPQVKCGNGVLEGSEKCDDANTKGGDGCSADCKTVESGFQCRVVGKACTPKCGDGVQSGSEGCDDGNTVSGDGCSATCRLELGWKCDGTTCTSTVCGDKAVEGAEGCDDGNSLPFDGCSIDCQKEPNCSGTAGCTSTCGDGIVLDEDCDDGNAGSGDGCTKDCKVEPGWTCAQPPLGDKMLVPALYHDFRYHNPVDFEPGVTGSATASLGMVKDDLDADGKPVFTGITGGAIGPVTVASFAKWYRDDPLNHATSGKLTLWDNGKGGYVNRRDPNGAPWYNTKPAYYCGNVGAEVLDANGDPIPCTSQYGSTDCDTQTAAGLTMLPGSCKVNNGSYTAQFIISEADGDPLFFPVDGDAFTPASERVAAQIPPLYDPAATWPYDLDAAGNKVLHNFSFTSEVSYWFKYDSTKTYQLDFIGDDDVWVFINKKLAVDLGGIKMPVAGSITLDAAGAAKFNNMKSGNVYQITVFQAERQTTSSTYKLTLSGFNASATECVPTCGDGVVVGDEECDCGDGQVATPSTCAGPNDNPAYNGCSSECKWGPFCGDGVTSDGEQCDNGSNNDDYGTTNGCAPGCKLPPRCGDGILQTEFDEECDDGPNNATSSDPKVAYGGCMSNCKRGGRCGDGIVNGSETCDDGVNDGTYGTCSPECADGPRCGDGTVQSDYGEECEPTMSDDPNCTAACRLPGGCGDGRIEPPEQCDDGELFNNGDYGGCAPSCIFAPRCGDGIMNGPEQCDDGIRDGTYGGCTQQCKLAPHCGDGLVNGPEECDHGTDNGLDGACSSSCKTILYLPP